MVMASRLSAEQELLSTSSSTQSLSVALNKLDEQLKCLVCEEEYSDPRTLPCLHSFCLDCIKNILIKLEDSSTEKIIRCPICRKLSISTDGTGQSPLPNSSESTVAAVVGQSLPKAHYLNSLLEMKEHYFLPLTYEMTSSLCPRHKEEYRLYCNTCSSGVCLECTVNGHTHHDLRRLTIEEMYVPEEGEIEDGWIKVKHPSLLTHHCNVEERKSSATSSIPPPGNNNTSLESNPSLSRADSSSINGSSNSTTNGVGDGAASKTGNTGSDGTSTAGNTSTSTTSITGTGPPMRLPTFREYTSGSSAPMAPPRQGRNKIGKDAALSSSDDNSVYQLLLNEYDLVKK